MAEDSNQTQNKNKSKGGDPKSTFVWDSSEKGKLVYKPIGKRSIMAKWAQEVRRAESLAKEKSKAKKKVEIGKVSNV